MEVYPVLNNFDQREAYESGYTQGVLVKHMLIRVSQYMMNSAGDYPLGSWSQQNVQGYNDAVTGLQPCFHPWRLT
jgi:hypothetical protein